MIDSIAYRIGQLVHHTRRKLNSLQTTYLMHYIFRRLGSVGNNCKINGPIVLSCPKNCSIGDNVHIGRNAWIRAEGEVSIGANTHISRNLVLYSVNHDFHGEVLPYDNSMLKRPVSIGKNVWIGMNVCITPGHRNRRWGDHRHGYCRLREGATRGDYR